MSGWKLRAATRIEEDAELGTLSHLRLGIFRLLLVIL